MGKKKNNTVIDFLRCIRGKFLVLSLLKENLRTKKYNTLLKDIIPHMSVLELFDENHENEEKRSEWISDSIAREIVQLYCTIVEECIKVIVIYQRKALETNDNGELCFDVQKIDGIYNFILNRDNLEIMRDLHCHKISNYYQELKKEIQEMLSDLYECYYKTIKEMHNDEINIMSFEDSLKVNDEYMISLKYDYKLYDHIIPCGVYWSSNKSYLFSDRHYNFAECLIRLVMDPSTWLSIVVEKYRNPAVAMCFSADNDWRPKLVAIDRKAMDKLLDEK